jgi:GPH family glycoside/pentoside/hexuronide:cation symporter
MQAERLPLSKIIYYGIGSFGWSLSINIISVMLLYLYLPPSNTGMVNLVPQITILGIFNLIALVMASGRLFDAIVDPFIAGWSDRSGHPKGRRIPLMALAVIPMVIFSVLMFFPPVRTESQLNLLWLGAIQLGYYFFFGLYGIPFNALVAELGHYPHGKMHLSTAQSVGFMVGVVASFSASALGNLIHAIYPAQEVIRCNQYAVILLNLLAGISMFVPVLFINEKRYVKQGVSTESVLSSLKAALGNRNFRIFAAADAAYFMSIAIITSGLLYYVKAILLLPEATALMLMGLMIVITLAFYPVVNMLEKRFSKKRMMVTTFFTMVFVFSSIFWLGRYPFAPILQAVMLIVSFGIPDGFLGILPPTVIADIADADAKATGQNKEGMYFGMRALFQKFGQTAGIMIFAMLTLYGKDPGNDLGLRLSGLVGAALCLFSGIVYLRYQE